MDATTADKLQVALERDDGAIERALADLDAKLSAWSKAMLAAQDAMRERASGQSTLETELSARESELRELEQSLEEQLDRATTPREDVTQPPVAAVAESPPTTHAAETEATTAAEAPVAEPPGHVAEEAAEAPAGEPAEEAARWQDVSDEQVAEESTPAAAIEPEAASAQVVGEGVSGTVEAAAPVDSDEALLASLDEEAVKKVRVMHRLAPDKSIRELIDKYQAEHAKEVATAQRPKRKKRKSWLGRRS